MDEVGYNSSEVSNSNGAEWYYFYEDKKVIVMVCFYGITILASLTLNIGVIVINKLGKCFEKNVNSVYVFYLAVGDLMKGTTFLITMINAIVINVLDLGDYLPVQLCVIPRVIAHFALNVSGYTLVLTSFAQYIAVVHPFSYTNWLNGKSFSKITILCGWAFCALELTFLHVYHLITDDDATTCSSAKLFGKLVNHMYLTDAIHFSVGFLLMVGLSSKIIKTVFQRSRKILPALSRKTCTAHISTDFIFNDIGVNHRVSGDDNQVKISNKATNKEETVVEERDNPHRRTKIPSSADSTSLTMISIPQDIMTSKTEQNITNSDWKTMHGEYESSLTSTINEMETFGRHTVPVAWQGTLVSPSERGVASQPDNISRAPSGPHRPSTSRFTTLATITLSEDVPSTSKNVNKMFTASQFDRTDVPLERPKPHRSTGHGKPRDHWTPYITLILLVVSYIICFGPYAMYTLFTINEKGNSQDRLYTTRLFSFFALINTIVNPIIYLSRVDVYRHYILIMTRRVKRHSGRIQEPKMTTSP